MLVASSQTCSHVVRSFVLVAFCVSSEDSELFTMQLVHRVCETLVKFPEHLQLVLPKSFDGNENILEATMFDEAGDNLRKSVNRAGSVSDLLTSNSSLSWNIFVLLLFEQHRCVH